MSDHQPQAAAQMLTSLDLFIESFLTLAAFNDKIISNAGADVPDVIDLSRLNVLVVDDSHRSRDLAVF